MRVAVLGSWTELRSVRSAHRALVIACFALLVLAFASDPAQRYVAATHWLAELSAIDLDNWQKWVENRQSTILQGLGTVHSVLDEEAERAQLPIKRGLYLRDQVRVLVQPSAAEVQSATMETLLLSVFRNVAVPQLIHPDEDSLRQRLRELFSGQFANEMKRFVLLRAALDFDTARDAPRRALLRLEWYPSDADSGGAAAPAMTRDVPLDGEYKPDVDFDSYIRTMHPGLQEASLTPTAAALSQHWSAGLREQLSPVWSEIEHKSLAAAYLHLQTRLNETKGSVTLLGLTIHRRLILVVGSAAALLALGALSISVRRLARMPRAVGAAVLDFPWPSSLSNRLALLLTFLSVLALPLITFGFLLVRFGAADLSGETVAAALAAGAGTGCAIAAFRSILELRRPKLSAADQQHFEFAQARIASYRSRALPRHRILGRVLLAIGFIAGPLGAGAFSLYLLGLGVGSDVSGALPTLAMLLSPVLVLVGWALAAGRKELVLFLRRFGNEALNDSVRDLVQTVLRTRARLVTLDDSAFVPLGPRWRGLAMSLAPSGIVLGLIALGYAGFAKMAQSELLDETPFGTPLVLIQIGIVAAGIIAGLVALALFAAALRAHFVGRRVVRDELSRARVVRRLRKLRSFARAPVIAAPMATVISVTDSEWQATVASIARMCDVTLIDISNPRENIRWELATLREARVRIVLLAQREALARWWDVTADDVEGRLIAQMRNLAAGLPLVTYDTPERLNETDLLQQMAATGSSGQ